MLLVDILIVTLILLNEILNITKGNKVNKELPSLNIWTLWLIKKTFMIRIKLKT